ncbi:MAG: hypothetical protein AB7T10_09580 [bacterium]
MNRKLNLYIFAALILLAVMFISLYFTYKEKPLFSLNENKYYLKNVDEFKKVYLKVNRIDSMYSTSAAYEIIKNNIILQLCAESGADTSYSEFQIYTNMLSSESGLSGLIDSINELFGEELSYKHFLKPLIAQNLLSDRISKDKLKIQKERYSEALNIFNKWKGLEVVKELLSPSAEYFLQKAENIADSSFTDKKQFYEDNIYYYIALREKDFIRGYRVKKVDFDEYAMLFKDKYKLKFYDKSYERAFLLLSEGSLWRELVKLE